MSSNTGLSIGVKLAKYREEPMTRLPLITQETQTNEQKEEGKVVSGELKQNLANKKYEDAGRVVEQVDSRGFSLPENVEINGRTYDSVSVSSRKLRYNDTRILDQAERDAKAVKGGVLYIQLDRKEKSYPEPYEILPDGRCIEAQTGLLLSKADAAELIGIAKYANTELTRPIEKPLQIDLSRSSSLSKGLGFNLAIETLDLAKTDKTPTNISGSIAYFSNEKEITADGQTMRASTSSIFSVLDERLPVAIGITCRSLRSAIPQGIIEYNYNAQGQWTKLSVKLGKDGRIISKETVNLEKESELKELENIIKGLKQP